MLQHYRVHLRGGGIVQTSRVEKDGKSVIGLWKWSMKVHTPVLIDFEDITIDANEIAAIAKTKAPMVFYPVLEDDEYSDEEEDTLPPLPNGCFDVKNVELHEGPHPDIESDGDGLQFPPPIKWEDEDENKI